VLRAIKLRRSWRSTGDIWGMDLSPVLGDHGGHNDEYEHRRRDVKGHPDGQGKDLAQQFHHGESPSLSRASRAMARRWADLFASLAL
jgi:hypothetical protein